MATATDNWFQLATSLHDQAVNLVPQAAFIHCQRHIRDFDFKRVQQTRVIPTTAVN
jgi:hypothetical protein